MFNQINNAPQDEPVTWHCGEFKRKTERVTPRQNKTLNDPHAGEISSQLNEAEFNNQKLRKLVDVLTRDRAILSDQLERANKEIGILNDFLLEKTKLITELSTTIGGNRPTTFQSNMNPRPASYATKAGQGNQPTNVR